MTTEPIISNIVRAAKRPDQSFKIKSNITCTRDRSTFDVEYTCSTTEPSVTVECPKHSPNKLFYSHVETIQEWSNLNEN